MQKKRSRVGRVDCTLAARSDAQGATYSVHLYGYADTHVLDREFSRRLAHTTKPQAEIHAAITALTAIIPKDVPVAIYCNSQVLARLLARDETGEYKHDIKANPEMSRRLRALVESFQAVEIRQDKDRVRDQLEVALGEKDTYASETRYTAT
jgi:ribonuclease HI